MAQQTKVDLTQYRRYFTTLESNVEKPKVRAYSTAILSLVAISLFIWFAIKPTLQTIFYLRKEIADKEIVNAKMEEKISALIEAQATYQQIEPNLKFLDSAIPKNPNALELIVQLKHLADISEASLSGVEVTAVDLTSHEASTSGTKNTMDSIASFPLSVSVTGSYGAISAFLDGLISLRRISTINILNLSTKIETTTDQQSALTAMQNPTIELHIDVLAYYRLK